MNDENGVLNPENGRGVGVEKNQAAQDHNVTVADTMRNRVDIDLPRVVPTQRPAEPINGENATVVVVQSLKNDMSMERAMKHVPDYDGSNMSVKEIIQDYDRLASYLSGCKAALYPTYNQAEITTIMRPFKQTALRVFIDALPDNISGSVERHEPEDLAAALTLARQAQQKKIRSNFGNAVGYYANAAENTPGILRPQWQNFSGNANRSQQINYNQAQGFSPSGQRNQQGGYRQNGSGFQSRTNYRSYNIGQGRNQNSGNRDNRLYNPNNIQNRGNNRIYNYQNNRMNEMDPPIQNTVANYVPQNQAIQEISNTNKDLN